jgi:hypothetical protein
MARRLTEVVLILVVLAAATGEVQAQAPVPKVTITGLFDQVTSAGRNIYDGNFSRSSESEWYARTRFRPDFTLEVGRTKAVLGLEMDLQYGQTGANDGSFGAGVAAGTQKPGVTGQLDLNNDIAGIIEIKWVYAEFDLTGKNSLLPFIPVETRARAGGQPFGSAATFKSTYATGDFAGLTLTTTWMPAIKTNVIFVQSEEETANVKRAVPPITRGNDFALILSPDIEPIKGLTIKPLYSYFHADGTTSGASRRSAVNPNSVGGNIANAPALPNAASIQEDRHTVGFDARWRFGPFSLDPTVFYQWGTRDSVAFRSGGIRRVEGDTHAWLVDVQGGWQLGPLLLEARAIYTTGNKARDDLSRGVRYFEPLDVDNTYYAGWANILSLSIDYLNGIGIQNGNMTSNIGYDRYGRAAFGARATYALTPALSFYGIVSPTWTAEKVDTDTGQAGPLRTIVTGQSFTKGNSRYIGTEADLGLTWRFAPNTTFDLVGAYLFAGSALDTLEIVNGVPTKREAEDGWTVAARVRLSF